MNRALFQSRRQVILALALLALTARIMVPAGWMPSNAGHATITLCTGEGMVQAWIDDEGKIHKSSPDKVGKPAGDCVFSALAFAARGDSVGDGPPIWAANEHMAHRVSTSVSIGHGLAAPPPPARGPPQPI